jgi:hypothetical protein
MWFILVTTCNVIMSVGLAPFSILITKYHKITCNVPLPSSVLAAKLNYTVALIFTIIFKTNRKRGSL